MTGRREDIALMSGNRHPTMSIDFMTFWFICGSVSLYAEQCLHCPAEILATPRSCTQLSILPACGPIGRQCFRDKTVQSELPLCLGPASFPHAPAQIALSNELHHAFREHRVVPATHDKASLAIFD